MRCKKCGSQIYYNSDYGTIMCYSCFEERLPYELGDIVDTPVGNGEVICIHATKELCEVWIQAKEFLVTANVSKDGNLDIVAYQIS